VAYRAPRILSQLPGETRFSQRLARIGRRPPAEESTEPRPERRPSRIAIASVVAKDACPSDLDSCKRRTRRKQTSIPGLITFRNLRLELPCTIADLSSAGARLFVPPTSLRLVGNLEHIPDELMLALRSDRTQVPCEIRWRLTNILGVRFKGPALPLSQPGTPIP
jgi:hypothetical protein